jgi:hypothetical protein
MIVGISMFNRSRLRLIQNLGTFFYRAGLGI